MNRRQARRLAKMLTSKGVLATIAPTEQEWKHDAGPWGVHARTRLYADPQELADDFNITAAALNYALTDGEPDREPSAEQERAWDEQYDGTSLGR